MSNKNWLKRVLIILLTLLIIYLLLFIYALYRSPKEDFIEYQTTNPFITDSTLIAAHRLGGGDEPEETKRALISCIESGADIIELDIHLTKDKNLILLHDETLDRTTDSEYVFKRKGVRPEELNVKEIKQLNGAKGFIDAHYDSVPDDLRVMLLDEVFDLTESKDIRFIIEIKSKKEEGKIALDILYQKLKERNLLDRVIFGTFDKELTKYCSATYPDINRSASIKEAIEFYFAALFNIKNYQKPCSVLQVFYGKEYYKYGINLATAKVINYAHSQDMAIQYWTVNEDDEIEYLIKAGADAVITDNVKRAVEIKSNLQK